MPEPLAVLADPRVIRRSLEGDVQGDLQSGGVRGRDESVEIVDRSESRVDRRVAALGCTDGPRAAGIPRLWRQRVVATLPECTADRMDGWQVDHVESHRGDVGEARFRFEE